MESIWQIGVAFALSIQTFTWLTIPMKFFTFLGSENFFLLVLPVLYWCVDTNLGLRVGVILLFNNGLNGILKLAMRGPRPYWYSTKVQAMAFETSFGVPSGHAQLATGVWGMMAAHIRRAWAWLAATVIIFLIGFSRLYLGVHFLHDVLLGWLLGVIVLWAFLRYWDRVASWAGSQTLDRQVLLAFGFSLALLLLGILAFLSLQSWTLPQSWLDNASAAGAGIEDLPAPVSLEGIFTPAGTLFGLLAGLAWINTRGGFRADGSLRDRVLRYLLGLVGIVLFWYGLGLVFPRGEFFLSYILRYVRYALVGGWLSAGAPYLFIRFGIAKKLAG